MKILVTGVAGFIGSTVALSLLGNGHTVVGIDNLDATYGIRLKQWRLARLVDMRDFTFVEGDILDSRCLERVKRVATFDAICNLAARAGVAQSISEPEEYYRVNVLGNLAMLEVCRALGVPKFVLASTSSVYGDGERPFCEDAPTDNPKSPYAASKKAAEVMTYAYHNLFGIHTTVLRYFTVYGPAGRPDMSIFRFIRWIAEGKSLRLNGDGKQERDFTYVDDIARGTVAAIELSGHHVINLGSDNPIQLNSVIEIIEHFLGRQANIEHFPMHSTDVMGTWADISKAKQLMGWYPQVGLEYGIHQSVQWYLENKAWAHDLAPI